MAVFREISIPFAGKDYVVTPSNKVLRRIEAKARREDSTFNLVAVFYRAISNSGGFYELSFVLAELLNSAGAEITEDDALSEFMGFTDPKELTAYITLICGLIMPEPKGTPKKPAPARKKATKSPR